ncbi:MAG: hypothetical protein IJS37_03055 [Bacilli bacterium]|nr:hypothetical protein [Bacilli bacterium]
MISNLALSQGEPFSAGDLVKKGKESSIELESEEVENQLKSLTKQGYLGRVKLYKFVVLKTTKQ